MSKKKHTPGKSLTLERIRSDIRSVEAKLIPARIDADHERIGILECDLDRLRSVAARCHRLSFSHDESAKRRKGR